MTVQPSKMATKPEKFPFILLVDINNFYKELNAYIHFVIFAMDKSSTLSLVVHRKLSIDIEGHRKFAINL